METLDWINNCANRKQEASHFGFLPGLVACWTLRTILKGLVRMLPCEKRDTKNNRQRWSYGLSY